MLQNLYHTSGRRGMARVQSHHVVLDVVQLGPCYLDDEAVRRFCEKLSSEYVTVELLAHDSERAYRLSLAFSQPLAAEGTDHSAQELLERLTQAAVPKKEGAEIDSAQPASALRVRYASREDPLFFFCVSNLVLYAPECMLGAMVATAFMVPSWYFLAPSRHLPVQGPRGVTSIRRAIQVYEATCVLAAVAIGLYVDVTLKPKMWALYGVMVGSLALIVSLLTVLYVRERQARSTHLETGNCAGSALAWVDLEKGQPEA